MKITTPPARATTAKDLHARKCFLLGITEPAKVERLWKAEEKRRAELRRAEGPRGRRRRA